MKNDFDSNSSTYHSLELFKLYTTGYFLVWKKHCFHVSIRSSNRLNREFSFSFITIIYLYFKNTTLTPSFYLTYHSCYAKYCLIFVFIPATLMANDIIKLYTKLKLVKTAVIGVFIWLYSVYRICDHWYVLNSTPKPTRIWRFSPLVYIFSYQLLVDSWSSSKYASKSVSFV